MLLLFEEKEEGEGRGGGRIGIKDDGGYIGSEWRVK